MPIYPRILRRQRDLLKIENGTHRSIARSSTLSNNAGATLKVMKCRFFTKTTDFLGHVVWLRHLKIASRTTGALRGLKALTDLTERRLFHGVWKVSKQFVPNFARIAALKQEMSEISNVGVSNDK